MAESKETATLAGGCFWCTEAVFKRLKGVSSVTPGYTGGTVTNPNWYQVASRTTGHAESIEIIFDPQIIRFEQLLEVFWKLHDPTTLNRQGADTGPEYRSAIFYHNEKQKQIAETSKNAHAHDFQDPIVTEIVPATTFYPAESEHKDFYEKNSNTPYCRIVIDPKITKLMKEFKEQVS